MSENNILRSALWYAKQGYSVIPILPPKADSKGKDEAKKPPIAWLPYQTQKATEDEIEQWFTDKPDMRLAIVTGATSNLTIFDCDTPEAIKQIESIFPDNFRVPIAISPRGGRHYYFQHEAQIPNKAGVATGIDTRSEGGYIIAPPSAGLNGKSYSWLEGCKISDIEVPALDSSLLSFFLSLNIHRARTRIASGVPNIKMFEDGRRDEDLFHTANCLVKGGMPGAEIRQVLENLIISWGEAPDQKWIDAKVESALKREETSEKSIMQEVREFISVTEGFFRVTEVEQTVTKVTRSPKAVRVALHRLCKEGVIEKSNLPGCYSVVEKHKDAVHINDVGEGAYFDDIILPMGLNRYVRLSPGNMVIIAGMTNSGKTGMLLNFIRDNMKHKCLYVTTEMSKEMTKERIKMFNDQLQWDFEIIDDWDERGTNIIRPNGITLIDWLKAPKETFNLADKLDELHKRVDKGLLVVALQKNPGTTFPYGGYQVISKSALYLSMDLDGSSIALKIGKAKAWASRENPYMLQCQFRLERSVNIIIEKNWMFEYEEEETKYDQFKNNKSKKSY